MVLPRGMTRVIRDNWDAIDEVVTETLVQLDQPLFAETALEVIDPDEDMYGCGEWGCAYPTTSKRWALKLSTDPFEGPITKGVFDVPHLREHVAVSYILGIWQLEEQVRWGRSPWRSVWVILREDITPVLPAPLRGRIGALAELLHTIRIAAAAANKYDREIERYGRQGRYQKMVQAEVLWERGLRLAEQTWELRDVADFQLDFFEVFGARLADIHAGNVGQRRHNLTDFVPTHRKSKIWTAYDLGHSHVDTGTEVPILRNGSLIPIIVG